MMDDYEDAHNESRESLVDPFPVVCPIGGLHDCKHFHHEGNDSDADYWCEFSGENENLDICPLDKIEE